ncbi:MAG: PaaI family thioesterase [Acetobacteraceae bacterium]|nr:PaaI family thioesterase [Acetobacteraceae bacterium]
MSQTLTRDDLASMTGLETLQAMMQGRLPPPPFAVTTRMHIAEAEYGRVVFEGAAVADFLNPLGTVHGGWIATLIDSAMACAVHSTLAAGQGYTTVEMKVHYVRAVTLKTPRVRCEGKIVHVGGRMATSEGRVFDADTGALLAHGTETCMIFTPDQK